MHSSSSFRLRQRKITQLKRSSDLTQPDKLVRWDMFESLYILLLLLLLLLLNYMRFAINCSMVECFPEKMVIG